MVKFRRGHVLIGLSTLILCIVICVPIGNRGKSQGGRSCRDADGLNYYIADSLGNQVMWVNLNQSKIQTIGNGTAGYADGKAATAMFNHPTSIALATDGTLYVADEGNNRIRIISPDRKTVTTLAGYDVTGFAAIVGRVTGDDHKDSTSNNGHFAGLTNKF